MNEKCKQYVTWCPHTLSVTTEFVNIPAVFRPITSAILYDIFTVSIPIQLSNTLQRDIYTWRLWRVLCHIDVFGVRVRCL